MSYGLRASAHRAASAVALLAVPTAAHAHPGHGDVGAAEVTHYLVEPLHAGVLLLSLVALVVMIHAATTKKENRRPDPRDRLRRP